MNINMVISQLKQSAVLFNNNVGGAAEYEKAVESQVWLPMPAAYVIPLEMHAGPNETMNGLYQICTEKVGIIVALDNSGDRRGQGTVATIDQVQAALFSALLNWRPDSFADNPGQASQNPEAGHESKGFRVDGAFLRGWDRARLFYEWDFSVDVTFTDADGWQQQGVPLTDIQTTITGGEYGQEIASFDTPIPTPPQI
jgi:hypothetical protein